MPGRGSPKNRRARAGGGPGAEDVVAYFNRGRHVAGDLLRENERLRSQIRRLECELRRATVPDPGGGNGSAG